MEDFKKVLVSLDGTILDVIQALNRGTVGIALLVDEQNRLVGTITDGDIRRAILAGINFNLPIANLLAQKANSRYPEPISAPYSTEQATLLRLMREHQVRQMPLLDSEGRVLGLVTLDELMPDQALPLQAMIMAGGYGTRLRPLTEALPKPLLPVGERPVMELIVQKLRQAGIRRVNVATHFLGEKITEHFGDGHSFGVDIHYVAEEEPLGTAGALGLMDLPDEPLLVINGDILTNVDFRAMLSFHTKHNANLTVSVRQYDLQVPYGVMECSGPYVKQVSEKPVYKFFVNAGIYLIDPEAFSFIPQGKHFDMTDLIEALICANRTVVSFPIMEYWLDIGQHDDYIQAQEDIRSGRFLS